MLVAKRCLGKVTDADKVTLEKAARLVNGTKAGGKEEEVMELGETMKEVENEVHRFINYSKNSSLTQNRNLFCTEKLAAYRFNNTTPGCYIERDNYLHTCTIITLNTLSNLIS